jgi:Endonuclease NucS C-terminal domain
MATDLQTWEIVNGVLRPIDTTLSEQGRTEPHDLEAWVASDPSIIRPGLRIIGRQVITRSGPLDLLRIDHSGDLYVIELKRERLPREALAQAIDYASDLQSWPLEKISQICTEYTYTKQSLEDLFNEAFPDKPGQSLMLQSIGGSFRLSLFQNGACPFPCTPLLSVLMLVTHTDWEVLPMFPGLRIMAVSM